MDEDTAKALFAERVCKIIEDAQGKVIGLKLFTGSLSPLVHLDDLVSLFNRHWNSCPAPFDLRVAKRRTDSGHTFAIEAWRTRAEATAAAKYLVTLCTWHEHDTAEGGHWLPVQVVAFPKLRTAPALEQTLAAAPGTPAATLLCSGAGRRRPQTARTQRRKNGPRSVREGLGSIVYVGSRRPRMSARVPTCCKVRFPLAARSGQVTLQAVPPGEGPTCRTCRKVRCPHANLPPPAFQALPQGRRLLLQWQPFLAHDNGLLLHSLYSGHAQKYTSEDITALGTLWGWDLGLSAEALVHLYTAHVGPLREDDGIVVLGDLILEELPRSCCLEDIVQCLMHTSALTCTAPCPQPSLRPLAIILTGPLPDCLSTWLMILTSPQCAFCTAMLGTRHCDTGFRSRCRGSLSEGLQHGQHWASWLGTLAALGREHEGWAKPCVDRAPDGLALRALLPAKTMAAQGPEECGCEVGLFST